MTIVEEPVATAEYDAIAAALRPFVGAGGKLAMPFAHVIGLAAEAVRPVFDELRAGIAAAGVEAQEEVVEAQEEVAEARAQVDAARAETRRVREEAAETLRRLMEEGIPPDERVVLLEAVAVQANARYVNDQQSKPLRDALVAAGYGGGTST